MSESLQFFKVISGVIVMGVLILLSALWHGIKRVFKNGE